MRKIDEDEEWMKNGRRKDEKDERKRKDEKDERKEKNIIR